MKNIHCNFKIRANDFFVWREALKKIRIIFILSGVLLPWMQASATLVGHQVTITFTPPGVTTATNTIVAGADDFTIQLAPGRWLNVNFSDTNVVFTYDTIAAVESYTITNDVSLTFTDITMPASNRHDFTWYQLASQDGVTGISNTNLTVGQGIFTLDIENIGFTKDDASFTYVVPEPRAIILFFITMGLYRVLARYRHRRRS